MIIFSDDKVLKIDLGCGDSKKKGYVGIDILPLPGVDHVVDIEQGLGFIPDNVVDEFYSSHFLEHVKNFELVMSEMFRTLKPDGYAKIIVPHFSNPYYYSDYSHFRFFGLYTFDYFSTKKPEYRRGVPKYNFDFSFEVESRKLIFKSAEFPVINLIRKHLIQRIFNLNPYLQEVYEAFFSKMFSCSEIHFLLKPLKK